MADLRGRHDMVCFNSSGYKLSRHNAIIAAMRAALSMIGVQSSTNTVLAIARGGSGTSQKQPDLAVYDFHQGGAQPTLLDVVVTDPTSSTRRIRAAREVGSASLVAEQRKRRAYSAQAEASGYRFKPVEGVDEVPDPVEPSAEEMRRVRLQRFGLATSGGVSAA